MVMIYVLINSGQLKKLQQKTKQNIVVQVNGKMKTVIKIDSGLSKDVVLGIVKTDKR